MKKVIKESKALQEINKIDLLRRKKKYQSYLESDVKEAVSPKGWNMSKKYIKILAREVKNLQKYHRVQNEEDFLEVASYMQLQLKYMLKDLNESVNEDSMSWEKHFKGYNEKELKVISKFIFMNPQGIDGVIKMSKKKDFKPLIKKMAQKGLHESVNERLNQSQAKTLLRQLGGNKFIMMTGAKQMSIGKNGLTMKIGRNSKSITHVAIDLDRGKDLYIMKFIRVRKGIPKVVKQYDGIYADNLNNIFEKETGLYTRL